LKSPASEDALSSGKGLNGKGKKRKPLRTRPRFNSNAIRSLDWEERWNGIKEINGASSPLLKGGIPPLLRRADQKRRRSLNCARRGCLEERGLCKRGALRRKNRRRLVRGSARVWRAKVCAWKERVCSEAAWRTKRMVVSGRTPAEANSEGEGIFQPRERVGESWSL